LKPEDFQDCKEAEQWSGVKLAGDRVGNEGRPAIQGEGAGGPFLAEG